MPRSKTEGALVPLVLVSVALALVAPVAGRAGWERTADLCMGLAASAGLLSFGVATTHTLRAARQRAPRRSRRESR
ncbi:MAG TPA: hypothetical protein VK714_06660 [Myxococcota bacterium]|nr:hypothetical protein [Myxococcota bacterium]